MKWMHDTSRCLRYVSGKKAIEQVEQSLYCNAAFKTQKRQHLAKLSWYNDNQDLRYYIVSYQNNDIIQIYYHALVTTSFHSAAYSLFRSLTSNYRIPSHLTRHGSPAGVQNWQLTICAKDVRHKIPFRAKFDNRVQILDSIAQNVEIKKK